LAGLKRHFEKRCTSKRRILQRYPGILMVGIDVITSSAFDECGWHELSVPQIKTTSTPTRGDRYSSTALEVEWLIELGCLRHIPAITNSIPTTV